MNSASRDKKNRLIYSFRYAISGINEAFKQERNLKIHLLVSIIVILMGLVLSISYIEWLFILLAIGGMLSLELLNSSIERVVDLVTEDYHPLAKAAKDIAAGAVLIFAVISVIIGLIIFLPKLANLI
ncbi:diacylglycerol kinase family protein [Bacillus sp. DTU_2020_1000418_1_SI_GHA_SEK_038]|uniref:diacylglycerol kinase family protein n=1 Tax=Bacillus sp. DTU_2020_1000418_1_SI_GHA_SEK_038 TaxID=3077585 RepID=UPI0028E83B94|nr:diacylglycerol kinase family protein [Bacillus sp. DTU_2020_1000418_1_SI_GHA_SEK_038]WNS74338.1 diacylglycerol kinase family protein [Bacillus sp. DTU_2020_1000418_1_SI_GHA_SEK_038]